jgi:multidrug efflux pump subunit AcrA (membrane-fusion protein)
MVTESSTEYLELTNSDEFLPPISRWATLGGLFLVGTFGVGIALAASTPYNVVVRANATVRPSGEIRIVQAASEGTVSSIHVRENQEVQQGDPIATIDDSPLQIQNNQLLEPIKKQQRQLLKQQQMIEAVLAQRDRSVTAIGPSSADLSISQETITQERATGEVNLARLHQEREALQPAKTEIETQIDRDRLSLKQMELGLGKTVIFSPETGTVFKLELRNIGQFVRPGDAIAKIYPTQDLLVIKAKILAEEIGKVRICKTETVADCKEGQVQMRVSAYPYPDYGTLRGAVRSISPDTISTSPEEFQDGNAIANSTPTAYYEVTIQPEKLELQKEHQKYPVQSGMEVTAEIIAQKETVLNFVLRKAKLIIDL